MNEIETSKPQLFGRAFWLIFLLVTLWVNASEIFRYFVFVLPMMRDALMLLLMSLQPISRSLLVGCCGILSWFAHCWASPGYSSTDLARVGGMD